MTNCKSTKLTLELTSFMQNNNNKITQNKIINLNYSNTSEKLPKNAFIDLSLACEYRAGKYRLLIYIFCLFL